MTLLRLYLTVATRTLLGRDRPARGSGAPRAPLRVQRKRHQLKPAFLAMVVLAVASWGQGAGAAAIDLAQPDAGPLGRQVAFLQEQGAPLALAAVQQAYAQGRFSPSRDAVLDFGIGAQPVWLRFEVVNRGSAPVTRRLSFETSWLDSLEIHVLRDGRRLSSQRMGDRLPFAERPIDGRFFALDQVFEPGRSTVFVRVASIDPMVLPIRLSSVEQAHARGVLESYSYGLLYGGIFSLLGYNLMLYFSLKSRRYLFYALYLAAFVTMNAAYTGHGYRYLWPDWPHWQQWSNPLLMMAFQLAGFLFATTFLNTRTAFPRQNRAVIGVCAVFAVSEALAFAADRQQLALLVSFVMVFVFSAGIILLGAMALRAGNQSAKYFLIASIAHVSTSALTAATVWGFIPYTALGYRAVEIGMMLDAILLAMALADQFRISQAQKIQAERLAKVDPLTQMNNRRAFYELLQPRWSTGLRKRHAMSVILLDIDHFKSINDRYGHPRGDDVLRAVARVLVEGARDGDILARWGGEEFILFLDETTMAEAILIAERFRHAIAALVLELDGEPVAVTASFGVAQAEAGNAAIDDLITTADKHLYLAKELGRNRVCSTALGVVVA